MPFLGVWLLCKSMALQQSQMQLKRLWDNCSLFWQQLKARTFVWNEFRWGKCELMGDKGNIPQAFPWSSLDLFAMTGM